MINKKGQIFSSLIILILVLLLFIFAAPIIFQFVTIGVAGTGTATGFVIRAFPWIILFTILAIGLKIITSGGDFL